MAGSGCGLTIASQYRGAKIVDRDPAAETVHYAVGACTVVSKRTLDANARAELNNSAVAPRGSPVRTLTTTRVEHTSVGCGVGVAFCRKEYTITTQVGGPGEKVHMNVVTKGHGASDTFHLVPGAESPKLLHAGNFRSTLIHNRWTDADGEHFFESMLGLKEGWELVIPSDPTKVGERNVYLDLKTHTVGGAVRPNSPKDIACELKPYIGPAPETKTAAAAAVEPIAAVAVIEAPFGGMSIEKSSYRKGDYIAVVYGAPIRPLAGEQYWITLAPAGSPDSAYGAWHYVANGSIGDLVPTVAAGEYEVRLHEGYPRRSNHVISRQKITVE
ncbi:MAG: hypothetical protein Q8P41_29255 [Pseudomonadota bacterium]|nr:hypothetical protein [Pseudomonadota bacterium]